MARDVRREALLFVLKEETEPRHFSIHRLAHYCLDLADLIGFRVPYDYIRSYPLFQAREALRTLRDALRQAKRPQSTTPSPT